MALCRGLGHSGGELTYKSVEALFLAPSSHSQSLGPLFGDICRELHETQWFSLLLPIILTTAFVIFGAWRSALRDAEVDAFGEDEGEG